jgi:hypothetical protein
MKLKMAASAGLSLTLDPMGKMFQNASSLKPISWISDRHKKQIICRGPSNDHSWPVWFQLSKWFQKTLGFLFRYEIQNGGYGRT